MRFASGGVRDHIAFAQNRPRTFVVALQSVAAAEKSKNQLSRDFRWRPRFATLSAPLRHGDRAPMMSASRRKTGSSWPESKMRRFDTAVAAAAAVPATPGDVTIKIATILAPLCSSFSA